MSSNVCCRKERTEVTYVESNTSNCAHFGLSQRRQQCPNDLGMVLLVAGSEDGGSREDVHLNITLMIDGHADVNGGIDRLADAHR